MKQLKKIHRNMVIFIITSVVELCLNDVMSLLRSNFVCPVFGHGCDLPISYLPTYEALMLC